MKNKTITIKISALIPIVLLLISCYSYTGTNLSPEIKSIQIDYFPNYSTLVNPNLSQSFTLLLQDYFQRRTTLNQINQNGDLKIEGEITDYRVEPTASSSGDASALNKLIIMVKIRYFNNIDENQNFEKIYSEFEEFSKNQTLSGTLEEDLVSSISEKIAQKVFNDTVANW